MSQVRLASYAADARPAPLPLSLSVFADRSHLRGQMRDDAEAAGFRVHQAADLASLLEGEVRALGDVVLLDCPSVDGTVMAALSRLDMRAANSGAQLIVSTSLDALDDVFACLDQSGAEILVEPHRSERVIALGRVLARHHGQRLRDMPEQDRLVLLRLTEQVARIAEQLDRLNPADAPCFGPDAGCRFEAPRRGFSGGGDGGKRLARPPLPDARLVRRIIRQRQLRAKFFPADLFADPAWDMMLDLTAARVEHRRVSVTSLCIASGVPPTTALRWIGQMVESGLFDRAEDDSDRRRAFITLSDRAADAMARYFAELGSTAGRMV